MDNWEKINGVQKMQDYINSNIHSPITLKDLARAAGYSPWHAARIFKELVGKSPFEFIKAVRLSKAAIKLRDENCKVIDVAFDFTFDSHEGFTRAFSKEFGISPKSYSKKTPPLRLFHPYPISHYYRYKNKGDDNMSEKQKAKTVFVQVVERPQRKLILKRGKKATGYFEYCDEVSCDPWGILTSIKDAMYEPIGMWLPENMVTPGTSVYAQGVEVADDYQGEIPEGFEIVDLPPCKMMVFQGEPFEDEDFSDAIGEMWNTIKNYNPEFYGFKWSDEDGPRFQLEPYGYRGYIEARPVRLLNS